MVAKEASANNQPSDPKSLQAWRIAATVLDPEVPVLTIEDLGVLRHVEVAGETVSVVLTPTYSGCPAIDQMRDDVDTRLRQAGYKDVSVTYTLSPAWSTDWMTEDGKRKLKEYGIAPPNAKSSVLSGPIPITLGVKCPRCDSLMTEEISKFGSTACKALYRCRACEEPFDYFKVH